MSITTIASTVVDVTEASKGKTIELSPSLMLTLIVAPTAANINEDEYRELYNDLYPPELSNAAKILASAIAFFLVSLTTAIALIATIPGRPIPKSIKTSSLNPDAVRLFDTITSDEFSDFQRRYDNQVRAAAILAAEQKRREAQTTLEDAKEEAAKIKDNAEYAAAPFVYLRDPGTPFTAKRQGKTITVDRRDGCDVAVVTRDSIDYYANLAPGTCIETGRRVKAGVEIGRHDTNPVSRNRTSE